MIETVHGDEYRPRHMLYSLLGAVVERVLVAAKKKAGRDYPGEILFCQRRFVIAGRRFLSAGSGVLASKSLRSACVSGCLRSCSICTK